MNPFRRKPHAVPVVCPLPPISSPALDAAEEMIRRTMDEAHERVDRTLERLRQMDTGAAAGAGK